MNGGALPDPVAVERLWQQHEMPEHIREHSRVVCRLGLQLADWLAVAGIVLSHPLIEAGALLHDIAKAPCLGSGLPHDQEGERLLAELGYPELGRLVGRHVLLPSPHPLDETMIVYYADKRVKHVQVVDLATRFSYIVERYGKQDPARIRRIEQSLRRAEEVERMIFAPLAPAHTPARLR